MKVSKKIKNGILLILGFFVVWFWFIFIMGGIILITSAEDEIFTPLVEYLGLGVVYLLIVLIVTVICYHSKKIDETYKNVICFFPVITLLFTLPMLYLVLEVHIFLKWFAEYIQINLL